MSSSSSSAPPRQVNASLSALIQATAGAGGGVWSMFMLFPLDTLKTLIQAGKTKSPSTLGALREILAEKEGALALYRGLGAKTIETASKNFLYFYAYEILVKIIKAREMEMTTLMNLQVGYWAGVANMLCVMPLEVLSTRLQCEPGGGIRKAAKAIIAEKGIAGLYSGLGFNMLLCLNPAIVNTVFDILKGKIIDAKELGQKFLTPIEAFLLGALSKCVATILTYPLVRLKTILQTQGTTESTSTGGSSNKSSPVKTPAKTPEKGSSSGARSLVPKEESVLQFYFRGLGPSLVKTALQAALMYMAKEKIALITKLIIKSAVHFMRADPGRRSKIKVLGGKPLA
ncbi:unnamed protein product [Amoebophrya sp. A120]|nr:unnamed protein product [Amoebophrya sp. A120]|eukprot:GSA120T00006875001.1